MILDGVDMRFYRGRITVDWLVSLTFLLAATPAHAADRLWNKPVNGEFSLAANWFGGVPGPNDVARFETTNSNSLSLQRTYTVKFTNNATNQQLVVEDDNVTFVLFDHTYTLRNSFVAAAIGTVAGRWGNLTVTDGSVSLPFQADLEIAPTSGASGVLTVGAGGLILGSPEIIVGVNGSGALDINSNGDLIADNVHIGKNSGATGAANVTGGGSSLLAASLVVGDGGVGTLDIKAGGRVDSASAIIGSVNASGFGSGKVVVEGAGSTWMINGQLQLGKSGAFGILSIRTGGRVNVSGQTEPLFASRVFLEGGTFSTAAIDFRGGEGNFDWTSGTLHVGTFDGSLVNQGGVLAPGNSAGTTQINGDYNQLAAAALQIEIAGNQRGIKYDSVEVMGNAFLGGNLDLALLNGFVPAADSQFAVLFANNIFGAFANVANGQRLMTSDGLGSFVVNYGPGSPKNRNVVILSAFAPGSVLPGDYNQNGTVDAADYVVWRDNLGSVTSLPNDDTAGVGPDDYTRWRKNFGQTSAAVLATSNAAAFLEAIPEPSVLNLSLLAISMLAMKRDR